jgi:hypothetical protein
MHAHTHTPYLISKEKNYYKSILLFKNIGNWEESDIMHMS